MSDTIHSTTSRKLSLSDGNMQCTCGQPSRDETGSGGSIVLMFFMHPTYCSCHSDIKVSQTSAMSADLRFADSHINQSTDFVWTKASWYFLTYMWEQGNQCLEFIVLNGDKYLCNICASFVSTKHQNVTDGRADKQTDAQNHSGYYSGLRCEQWGCIVTKRDWHTASPDDIKQLSSLLYHLTEW